MPNNNSNQFDTNEALSAMLGGDSSKIDEILKQDEEEKKLETEDPSKLITSDSKKPLIPNDVMDAIFTDVGKLINPNAPVVPVRILSPEEKELRAILGIVSDGLGTEEVQEEDLAFSAGSYFCFLGKTYQLTNNKGTSIVNEFFVLNFYGTPDRPKAEARIEITENKKVSFHKNKAGLETTRGLKFMEFYAQPGHQYFKKQMEFRKRAFCKPFGAFDEESRTVSWDKMNELIGTTFHVDIVYNRVKNKSYRNIDYMTIIPYPKRIPLDIIVEVYNKYNIIRKEEEASEDSFIVPPPTQAPKLPDFLL